jgi:hypothetical protein
MPEYGMETLDTASQNEGENTQHKQGSDADTFLGLTRTNSGTPLREGHSEMLWDWLRQAI